MDETGYIHMTHAELKSIPLVHLISGISEDDVPAGRKGEVGTTIVGYSEWTGGHGEVLTIGWDWRMGASDGKVRLHRLNAPLSNLMLHDALGESLGPQKTAMLLGKLIDEFDWESQVLRHINMRYAVTVSHHTSNAQA